MAKSYGHAIAEAKASGRISCTCWDHLREAGITPHRTMRDKHKRLYPQTVFSEDPDGQPQPERQADSSKEKTATTSTERAHLREAVRNRAAI